MSLRYLAELITPEVRAAEERQYGRSLALPPAAQTEPDVLGPDEREHIERRDSFYLATVGAGGWPYIQHRGGPPGFLKVLGPRTLGFADLRGNRQLISTGHLAVSDKVSLFLMDYPRRERLKLLGHARVVDPAAAPALAERLRVDAGKVERLMVVDVVAFDWNCPAFITPRYTVDEIQALSGAAR